jgi:hypothetical protein
MGELLGWSPAEVARAAEGYVARVERELTGR